MSARKAPYNKLITPKIAISVANHENILGIILFRSEQSVRANLQQNPRVKHNYSGMRFYVYIDHPAMQRENREFNRKSNMMARNKPNCTLLETAISPPAPTLVNISLSSAIFVVPVFANKTEKTISKIADPIPLYIK